MPMALQARLLRVLEEREVVPLGGETPITVDIQVISATHRELRELVAEGQFREDLYRITSYNVCYTKLLRSRVTLPMTCCLRRESDPKGSIIPPWR